VREFTAQYKCNDEFDALRRDMETTKQFLDETFSAYTTRWRAKATKMMNYPTKDEELQMIMKNLLLEFKKYMGF